MKYFKLLLISVFVFSLMIFCISLLFPSITYVSRAKNISGTKETIAVKLPSLCSTLFSVPAGFVTSSLGPDTVTFKNQQAQGGLAVYHFSDDSSTLQAYYKIVVPWYQPWNKFGLLLNEEKYGPSLDAALAKYKDRGIN